MHPLGPYEDFTTFFGDVFRRSLGSNVAVLGRSLENRGIFLKRTTREIISLEEGFLSFLKPLISVGLPLMKNVLTPLAKSILVPFGLTAAASAADAKDLFLIISERNVLDRKHQH